MAPMAVASAILRIRVLSGCRLPPINFLKSSPHPHFVSMDNCISQGALVSVTIVYSGTHRSFVGIEYVTHHAVARATAVVRTVTGIF